MKIGFDARAAKWYRGTGIGTYTFQLINFLSKIDNINDYLLFMPKYSNLDIKFPNNFNINNLDEKSTNNFWSDVNIPNILSDQNMDLYHVPQNGVGLPLNKICPFIITLHDIIPYRMPETTSDKYLRIFQDELPKIVSLCDGIITVSNFSKKDISKAFKYPEDKIHVTYLAAEDMYKPLDKNISKKIIKNNYGIPECDFILYVGGFSPRKNISNLLNAFKLLIEKKSTDLKLVIAGRKGPSFEKYKIMAQKLGLSSKVIFPGFISTNDMPYLYNSAKLFVYLSFYEGFGLPPLEAMACGIPVVASNVTSLPEILKDCAVLVSPFDELKIYESLYRTLDDSTLRENLIKKGFLLNSKLKWSNTAISTLNAYKSILNL
ncbi:MAG: glycosyltransferase family 1 protein [Clostridium sp.]|nr:glycosyltransferase family 1 protein [Clostridium sp.]